MKDDINNQDAFLLENQNLKNCFINFNGEIYRPFKGWENLVETSKPQFKQILRTIFHGKIKIRTDERVILIYDAWSSGYFHWIIDVLPKIYLLRDQLKDLVIILPKKLSKFQKDSLAVFNFKEIIELESWELAFCTCVKVLRMPWQSGYYPAELYIPYSNWLLNIAKEQIENTKELSFKNLFIDRQSAPSRRITNFESVKKILDEHDVTFINPSNFTLQEQIYMFSKAELLVGAHGAGLVNMLFMNDRSKVIEFRNTYPEGNNCYERLAKLKHHSYEALANSNKRNYNGDFQSEDIEVPIDKLIIYLKSI